MRSTLLLQIAFLLQSTVYHTAAQLDSTFPEDSLAARGGGDDSEKRDHASESITETLTLIDKSGTHTVVPVFARTTDADSSSATDDSSDLNTAKPESSGKDSGKDSGKGPTKTSHTQHHSETFPPDSPPGGISMLIPATTALPTPLYKIGDWVTLSWNYTSLLGDPTAVDVLLSCSTATETWTLTSNMSFHTNAKYYWDTNKQASDTNSPLLNALYTLIIKDSDSAITDVPNPGYLGVYSGLTMGLYATQPYQNYSDWTCPGCSAAVSTNDRHFAVLAISMSLLSIFSFTWFVSGLNLQ